MNKRGTRRNIHHRYAEGNYTNSLILWSIYRSPYGDNLLFNGGTALDVVCFNSVDRLR